MFGGDIGVFGQCDSQDLAEPYQILQIAGSEQLGYVPGEVVDAINIEADIPPAPLVSGLPNCRD